MTTRIHLWSSPRNISTALMYSFAQRSDTTVVDEPLYAWYLAHTSTAAEHPGVPDIMASQSADGTQVTREVLCGHAPTSVVVFKQMTHHLLHLDRQPLHAAQHVLLIRDPRAILNSYRKVVNAPTAADIGVPQQDEWYDYLVEQNLLTAIVDAKRLLSDPPTVLRALCDKLAIPFESDMLQWPAGARPEDGVWAKYWYHNVHQSTGFQPYVEREITLPPALEEVALACQPHYERLLSSPYLL
ncbi:MAG: hypothetical protein AAGJ82_03200 [Bacteroidota bacterium]